MAFDIEKWKQSLQQSLPGFRDRMKRAGVNSTYAMLSAMSLWPVVEASRSGDYAALMAVGGILGNVGANLVSNIIQNWRDEASTAEELEKQLVRDEELRQALDKIMTALEAPQLAEKSLSESDRTWFAETLKAEIAQLKSGISYTATVIGGGASAQGNGAKAVGAGGILIEGGVHANRDVILGDQTNHYNAPDPRELEAEKRQKALEIYLNRLSRNCLSLPLNALGGEESTESDVTLDRVYIELNTTEKIVGQKDKRAKYEKEDEDRPRIEAFGEDEKSVTALESACDHKRLTLLGDPGAGKSTFVKKLLAWQASACMGKAKPPEGFDPKLLPVLVLLRDLSPYLADLGEIDNLPADRRDDALADAFWDYLCADLGKECDGFGETLRESLQNGNCLLVLDGLDEVPHDLRGRVRQTVDALLKHYRLQRVIITCRVRSYVGEAVLPQFTSRTLAPFNQEQIQNFVQGWYKAQLDLGRFSESQA